MTKTNPQLDKEKTLAAQRAAELAEDGMILGLGSGSTVARVLMALGRRIEGGLRVRGVSTSLETTRLAGELNIPLMSMEEAFWADGIDLTLDGTDEFDPQLNLIKGGGGALLREKMVAAASHKLVIVADSSKQVKQLGVGLLPLEVATFGWQQTAERLKKLGCQPQLRYRGSQPWLTDNGGYILDCNWGGSIPFPSQTEAQLRSIMGVLETGLFCNMTQLLLMGHGDKVMELRG